MQYCPAKSCKLSEIVLHLQIPGLAGMAYGAKDMNLDYSSDESSTEGSGRPLLKPNESSKIGRGASYH